jgi:hypothetical protein
MTLMRPLLIDLGSFTRQGSQKKAQLVLPIPHAGHVCERTMSAAIAGESSAMRPRGGLVAHHAQDWIGFVFGHQVSFAAGGGLLEQSAHRGISRAMMVRPICTCTCTCRATSQPEANRVPQSMQPSASTRIVDLPIFLAYAPKGSSHLRRRGRRV